METGILQFHSGLRYIVLLMLLWSLAVAYRGLLTNKVYSASSRQLHSYTQILLMIQGLIGIVLYLLKGYPGQFAHISNLPDQARFFLLKHLISMLVGILVCGIGYRNSIKAETDKGKFKAIAIFYTISLLIILSAIPWSFIYSFAK